MPCYCKFSFHFQLIPVKSHRKFSIFEYSQSFFAALAPTALGLRTGAAAGPGYEAPRGPALPRSSQIKQASQIISALSPMHCSIAEAVPRCGLGFLSRSGEMRREVHMCLGARSRFTTTTMSPVRTHRADPTSTVVPLCSEIFSVLGSPLHSYIILLNVINK